MVDLAVPTLQTHGVAYLRHTLNMKYIIPLFLISLLVADAASAEENSKKIKKIGFLIPLSVKFK